METRIALRAKKSLVSKATESRNEIQKVSEKTGLEEAPADESSKKSQTTRSTESEATESHERTVQSR